MLEEVKEFVFDDVKLFECECKVMDTKAGHPLLSLEDLTVNSDVVVQVLGFEDKPIGAVSFHVDNDGYVVADIDLEYSCPERLDIETNEVYLEVTWFLGDEAVTVHDIDVCIDWIEPFEARLTMNKPFSDATPLKIKKAQ